MTPASSHVFGGSTMSTMMPSCSWSLLNRSGVSYHATLFVLLDIVSVSNCVEMKEVGRGKCFSTIGLRQFCTGFGEWFDVLLKGVFRSTRLESFVERLVQVSCRTICRSIDRYDSIQPQIQEEAAVVLRPWGRG